MAGDLLLVRGLCLSLTPGSMLGILGRNGTGKTTTLHTLAGLAPPAAGTVLLEGRPLARWPRRDVARRVGLLMQSYEDPFPSTVLETVVIGRHPHLGFWQWETETDYGIARAALAEVGLNGLEARRVETLSGGERRRLALATVLAQRPGTYLLDEPSNHLDPHHQHDVMSLMRSRAGAGAAVAASLHDVNAAARWCDRCLLLFGDGQWCEGPTEVMLTETSLSRLYGIDMRALDWRERRVFVSA